VIEKDAKRAGIDKVAEIVSSGSAVPGTIVSKCSDEFKELFRNADIVLSKGQGNYEGLSDEKTGDILSPQSKMRSDRRTYWSTCWLACFDEIGKINHPTFVSLRRGKRNTPVFSANWRIRRGKPKYTKMHEK